MPRSTKREFEQWDELLGDGDLTLDWIDEINRRIESLRRYDEQLANPDLTASLRQHWEEMKLLDLRDLKRLVVARQTGGILVPQVRP